MLYKDIPSSTTVSGPKRTTDNNIAAIIIGVMVVVGAVIAIGYAVANRDKKTIDTTIDMVEGAQESLINAQIAVCSE